MQNTLPLTPGNPLRNITGLARQISLPGEHAPVRFPSFPALERTAVMGFNQPYTLPLAASEATAVTLFRQATWPIWADETLSATMGWCYAVDFTVQSDPTAVANTGTIGEVVPAPYGWTVANRTAGTGVGVSFNQVHKFTYPLVAVDDHAGPGLWIYAPAGCSLTVVVGSNVALPNTNFAADLDLWTSPGEYSTASLNGTCAAGNFSGAATLAITTSGWWRVKSIIGYQNGAGNLTLTTLSVVVSCGTHVFVPSAATLGTVTTTFVAAKTHIPMVAPAEFVNSALPWYATRTTAVAMLGTNVTQVLNKSGTVLGGRVSPAVQNAWSISSSYVNTLHPAEKAFLALETGVYTYAPPSTDLVFFADYTLNTANGAKASPVFRLDNDSLYNKMYLTPGSVAESLAVTATWHIEFRTSSALFQVGLSAMTLESLHQAQLVLVEHGFFFENPEHEKLLGKIVSTAKKYAPGVVSMINPMAGRMLQSILSKSTAKSVKPKPGPSKPPTTSAKKSGMLGGPRPKPAPKPKGKGGKK